MVAFNMNTELGLNSPTRKAYGGFSIYNILYNVHRLEQDNDQSDIQCNLIAKKENSSAIVPT